MPNRTFTLTLALLAACASATAMPPAPNAVPASAPAAPEVDLLQVAALRAQGPAALERLLAEYDRAPAQKLADTIDLVAAQKHATVSRLYWYTDRALAIAVAQQRHQPILELRLLGRLDEELSCANSRLFRATLYANQTLSRYLRENFVLLWTSERPVPKVTIDFGDGRTIRTTTTGNSAHLVLDERGEVVDVLPGLYAALPFYDELHETVVMMRGLDPKDAAKRARQLRDYHAARAQEVRDRWRTYWTGANAAMLAPLLQGPTPSALARAQSRTVAKAYLEVPQLVAIGVRPGALDDDETAVWAKIATEHWGTSARVSSLDRQVTSLVAALHNAGPLKATPEELRALMARFEQHLYADTALAELKLRPQIHEYLATHDATYLPLDRFLYGEVFQTPITDRWLGLLPRTDVTGLAGDGATAP